MMLELSLIGVSTWRPWHYMWKPVLYDKTLKEFKEKTMRENVHISFSVSLKIGRTHIFRFLFRLRSFSNTYKLTVTAKTTSAAAIFKRPEIIGFMSLCSDVHTEHKGIKGIKLCHYVVMSPV